VELVLPGRQPDGQGGGHHEPTAAAGGRGAGSAQRWANDAVLDANAGQGNLLKRQIANIHVALQQV
jgi:hypothetical protein